MAQCKSGVRVWVRCHGGRVVAAGRSTLVGHTPLPASWFDRVTAVFERAAADVAALGLEVGPMDVTCDVLAIGAREVELVADAAVPVAGTVG